MVSLVDSEARSDRGQRKHPAHHRKEGMMASKEKRATDALCEIMRDAGFACDADSQCWKRAECDHAQKLVRALRSGEAGKGAG